jgi:1,4-dihydroxy-2-naphthoate polyprenyltransferase
MTGSSETKRACGGLRIWLDAARPKTLWAGVAPVLMGTAMAASDGALHVPAALGALAGAVLIQAGTNYINDYYDFAKGTDTAERLGPARAIHAGLVTPAAMKRAAITAFAFAVLAGLYLVWRGGWPIALIGLLSIFCGVLYTGGPLPLGYIGAADIFVLLFFGPVALGGTYYAQALAVTPAVLVAGLAPGLLSVALLTVNNLRDIQEDRRGGKKTLAVRFGPRFARFEYLFCITAGILVLPPALVWISGGHAGVLLSCLLIVPAGLGARRLFTASDAASQNRVLGLTGKLLLGFSLFFSAGWLL